MSSFILNVINFPFSITQIIEIRSLPEDLNDIGTGREEVLECLHSLGQDLAH